MKNKMPIGNNQIVSFLYHILASSRFCSAELRLTALVMEFLRLPTTIATSSAFFSGVLRPSSLATMSSTPLTREAVGCCTGGEDTIANELGGKTNPRLMSE